MSEPTFIVWADPGQTTGAAWYDMELNVFGSGQYDFDDLRRKLTDLHSIAGARMAIGWELYVSTSGGARTGTPTPSNKAIGMMRSLASEKWITILKPQPSSARNLGSVPFLRRLGWYKPGKGHANDAAQHLLAHLIRQRPMHEPIREKLFPGYVGRGTVAP